MSINDNETLQVKIKQLQESLAEREAEIAELNKGMVVMAERCAILYSGLESLKEQLKAAMGIMKSMKKSIIDGDIYCKEDVVKSFLQKLGETQ